MHRASRHFAIPGVVLAACCGLAVAQDSPIGETEAILASLQRTIRHFDFEEAELAPRTMPVNFYRHEDGAAEGFPPFGDMGLADDMAASGRWSFRFELQGGSMSARIPTGVLPVLPDTAYRASVLVRTRGLQRARVRLVVWMHDLEGNAISASRVESRPVLSEQGWTPLTVDVPGAMLSATDSARVADLVVELQLLQPAALEADTGAPRLQDVSGLAWFDDLVIRMLPRVEMTTGAPGNVIVAPDVPRVMVRIEDVAREHLAGAITLIDLDGHETAVGTVEEGAGVQVLELPLSAYGWYQAQLVVTGPEGPVDSRTIALAYVPRREPVGSSVATSLGVVIPPTSSADLEWMPGLIDQLEMNWVVLPVIGPERVDMEARLTVLRRTIERLLDDGVELVLGLDGVSEPDGADDDRGDLSQLLINFGLQVRRWQLAVDPRLVSRPTIEALRRYVAQPTVYVDRGADSSDAGAAIGRRVVVPCTVAPESFAATAADWPAERDRTLAILELPGPPATRRHRVTDALLRGLAGWRLDAPRIAIDAPWSRGTGTAGGDVSPDPVFGAWRQLQRATAGRRFGGELDLADGVTTWIMQATDPARGSALVLWRGPATPGPITVRTLLSNGPVELVDAAGNRDTISPDGRHAFEVDATPVFVEGVDLDLARFRGSLRMDPAVAASSHRAHEHEILLANPWPVGISGTIRFDESDEWRLTPRTTDFTIPAGGEVRLPVTVVFARSVLAGRKRLECDIALTAEHDLRIRARTSITVGWPEIEVSTETSIDGAALVVAVTVTSHAAEPILLDAHVLARDLGRRQRPIGVLPPGETIVRTFRLEDAAALLAGTTIRVGVTERNGAGRVNQAVPLPGIGSGGTDD